MKTKAIAINIAEPCKQNWDLMEDRTDERFCKSCQKCVIDFSSHSNAEIIKVLSSSKSDICGRMTNKQLAQLNHYLIAVPNNNNWLKYLGVLAIGVSIFAGEARGNVLKDRIPTTNSPIKSITKFKPTFLKSIYGYVFDENKKPVSGIKVIVADTKLFAITDVNGKYEIKLGENSIPKTSLIKVVSPKFEGAIKINISSSKQANINLQELYMIMGKIAFVNKN